MGKRVGLGGTRRPCSVERDEGRRRGWVVLRDPVERDEEEGGAGWYSEALYCREG